MTIRNQILCQAQSTKYVKITATQATFGLIDPTLIYNRFFWEFDFQWDIKFMTQLNGPAGYTRAQHICRDAPKPQIAVHALLQARHLCLSACSSLGFHNSCSQTCAGQCVGPQKQSLKTASLWCRRAGRAHAQMEAEGGSRGFGVFILSTVCLQRGAGGSKEEEEEQAGYVH